MGNVEMLLEALEELLDKRVASGRIRRFEKTKVMLGLKSDKKFYS